MPDSLRYNLPNFLVGSQARTVNGNSGAEAGPDPSPLLAVLVNVTAVAGTTPNLVVGVQWSPNGGSWYAGDPADLLTAFTATGLAAKTFQRRAPFHRLFWTITGTTPSFTFDAATWLFG